MKIKQIMSRHRNDFYAIYECEHCDHVTKEGTGYNDDRFHNDVIPAWHCSGCDKNRAGVSNKRKIGLVSLTDELEDDMNLWQAREAGVVASICWSLERLSVELPEGRTFYDKASAARASLKIEELNQKFSDHITELSLRDIESLLTKEMKITTVPHFTTDINKSLTGFAKVGDSIIADINRSGSTIHITTAYLTNPNSNSEMSVSRVILPPELTQSIICMYVHKENNGWHNVYDSGDIFNNSIVVTLLSYGFKLGFRCLRDELPDNYVELIDNVHVEYTSE